MATHTLHQMISVVPIIREGLIVVSPEISDNDPFFFHILAHGMRQIIIIIGSDSPHIICLYAAAFSGCFHSISMCCEKALAAP